MLEFYIPLRHIHITAVIASGALFVARGIGLQLAARWPMAAPVRFASYGIDTVLLTAAILLSIAIRQYPFAQDWLTVKVLLLVVYIVLGVFAFKRGRTPTVRRIAFIAAIAVYLYIVSVARAHDPLGFLAGLRLA